MEKLSEHVSLGRRAELYWVESRRPLASLVFIAPLLIVYETGVLLFACQTGADTFLRWLLGWLGFSQYFLLPILTVCILLGWHHLAHQPWRLSGSIISAMAVESLILGLCVWGIALVQGALFAASFGETLKEACRASVGYLGAGIYEELLFRLMLLSLFIWAMRKAGATPRIGAILAVLANGAMFAAAHYVGPYGFQPDWRSFVFRGIAGVFFAVVFLYRGFGIAAGSHAAFDILVGLSRLSI